MPTPRLEIRYAREFVWPTDWSTDGNAWYGGTYEMVGAEWELLMHAPHQGGIAGLAPDPDFPGYWITEPFEFVGPTLVANRGLGVDGDKASAAGDAKSIAVEVGATLAANNPDDSELNPAGYDVPFSTPKTALGVAVSNLQAVSTWAQNVEARHEIAVAIQWHVEAETIYAYAYATRLDGTPVNGLAVTLRLYTPAGLEVAPSQVRTTGADGWTTAAASWPATPPVGVYRVTATYDEESAGSLGNYASGEQTIVVTQFLPAIGPAGSTQFGHLLDKDGLPLVNRDGEGASLDGIQILARSSDGKSRLLRADEIGRLFARLAGYARGAAIAAGDEGGLVVGRGYDAKAYPVAVSPYGHVLVGQAQYVDSLAGRIYTATTARVQLSVAGNMRFTHQNPAGSGKVCQLYETSMSGDINAIAVLAHRLNPTAGLPATTPIYAKNKRWTTANDNNNSVLVIRHDTDTSVPLSGGADGSGFGFNASGNMRYPSSQALEPGVTMGTNVGFAGAAAVSVNWFWIEELL